MTKLVDWIAGICAFLSIYFGVLYISDINTVKEHQFLILLCPFSIVLLFGVYAAQLIIYRVYNFNDCKKEAADLQEEIQEARRDLQAKGFTFAYT